MMSLCRFTCEFILIRKHQSDVLDTLAYEHVYYLQTDNRKCSLRNLLHANVYWLASYTRAAKKQVDITCGVQIKKECCIPESLETPSLENPRHWWCSLCAFTCEFVLIRKQQSNVRKQVAIITCEVSNIMICKCIPQSQESYGSQHGLDPTH